MSHVVRTSLALGVFGLLLSSAHASDGFVPRTPVLWEDVPCLERVDRSSNPVLHLDYSIPQEDTELTPDEVADSRTHQFFAFCRRKHSLEYLPNWITWADVEAAREAGALEEEVMVDDEDVLETSTRWAGCWWRITPDDERRPITHAVAAQGVDWDTTGLPTGGYTVYGYTHHPPLSPWFIRPGVVKVHDGDPDAAGPAAATFLLPNPDIHLYNGQMATIEGCLDSATPAVVSGYYAASQPGEPTWVPFAEGTPVDGDTFALEFFATADLANKSVIVRIDAKDPAGREHVTYMDETIFVLAGTDPSCQDEGGGFIGGPECDDDGEAGTGDDTGGPSTEGGTEGPSSGSDTESGPPGQQETPGCSCSATGGPGLPLLSLLLLGGLGAVRRRAC
jgi:MYXO-CTERM domain-containing protein